MKRRYVGAVLAGLGVLFLIVAAGLPLYVAPAVTKLPYNMKPCPKPPAAPAAGCLKPSVAEASGARFLQITGTSIEINTATLRSTTEVLPQPKLTATEQKAGRLGDNSVVWDVYQTNVRTDTDELVGASSTELALDRVTGAAVTWSGEWIDEAGVADKTIRYSDQIYKFPFGTDKRDYRIYDTDVRAASTARFRSVEDIKGTQVYHFVQDIPESTLDIDKDSMGALLGRFAPGATSGRVVYTNTREVWVDPVTGAYIKVREHQFKELRPDVGNPQVLLDADFVYTDDTIANSARSAQDNGSQLKLVNLYGPVVLGIVALLLIGGGLTLAGRRAAAAGGDSGSFDDSLPEPRHGLRGEGGGSLSETGPGPAAWPD